MNFLRYFESVSSMTWITSWALKVLGLTPQVYNFLKVYVLPFVKSNWGTIVAVLPVVMTFIRTASTKDMSGQAKQDYVVQLLREELVKKGVITAQEDASQSLLQLIVLIGYRFVTRKDPTPVTPVEPIKE